MRIATWNVNSIRTRLPRLLPWLDAHRPDVLCLQETKCTDEQFPRAELEERGYHVEAYGQKTYNGVATLTLATPEDVVRGLPGDGADADRRALALTVGGVRILNLYVVNGRSVGDPKYRVKLDWLARLAAYVHAQFPMDDRVVLTGDFNCTFDDRDVYDPEAWKERILCSTPEREALAAVMSVGLTDAFRKFHEEGGHYTWWDFRTRGFRRDQGLRIDHFLLSPPALEACTAVEIDKQARGGPKPSDHAPVVATLA